MADGIHEEVEEELEEIVLEGAGYSETEVEFQSAEEDHGTPTGSEPSPRLAFAEGGGGETRTEEAPRSARRELSFAIDVSPPPPPPSLEVVEKNAVGQQHQAKNDDHASSSLIDVTALPRVDESLGSDKSANDILDFVKAELGARGDVAVAGGGGSEDGGGGGGEDDEDGITSTVSETAETKPIQSITGGGGEGVRSVLPPLRPFTFRKGDNPPLPPSLSKGMTQEEEEKMNKAALSTDSLEHDEALLLQSPHTSHDEGEEADDEGDGSPPPTKTEVVEKEKEKGSLQKSPARYRNPLHVPTKPRSASLNALPPRQTSSTSSGPPRGSKQYALSTEELHVKYEELQQQVNALDQRREYEQEIERLRGEVATVKEEKKKEEETHQAEHSAMLRSTEETLATARAENDKCLQEKEEEIAKLKENLASLESLRRKAREALEKEGENGGNGALVTLSAEEVAFMRQEMKEQEELIRGYQVENEAATLKLKELQTKYREQEVDIDSERQRMAEQMAIALRAAEDSRNDHSYFKRVLQVEAERDRLRDDFATREKEMGEENERLREAKKSLEAKLGGGVDLRAYEEEDTRFKNLEIEMNREREQYRKNVETLEGRLRWYVENQEASTKEKEEVEGVGKGSLRHLKEENAKLRQELKSVAVGTAVGQLKRRRSSSNSGSGSSSTLSARAESAYKSKIKSLEEELTKLKEAIMKKHPNSLPAMMLAARPTAEENETVRDLEVQVRKLEEALLSKEKEMEISLRALRQEHDKLRLQYDSREKAGRNNTRVKEMARQVEDVRSHYSKKIKEMQKKLDQQASLLESQDVTIAKKDAKALEKQVRVRDATISNLQGELRKLKNQKGGANSHHRSNSESMLVDDLQEQLAQEKARADKAEEDIATYRNHSEHSPLQQARLNTNSGPAGALLKRDLRDLSLREASYQRENHDMLRQLEVLEISRDTLQKAHADAIDRLAHIQIDHERQMQTMQDQYIKRMTGLNQPQEKLLERAEESERESGRLRRDLEECKKSLREMRGTQRDFSEMDQHIKDMEAKQMSREQYWTVVVQETKRLAEQENAMLQQKWQLLLESKNAEIKRFSLELESIIQMALMLERNEQDKPRGVSDSVLLAH